ncbi:glycosyltransferase family 4 protein [Flavobacterium sp. j3]|uniref:Glycosyltransferase family 4 protein n=1 Tax=Flavobacterium aureirubrum TaxID=3133147 RepID=A0ABU9N7P1_9FLAO
MDSKPKKIAVICDYRLMPERIGGMDYFFWMFNQKCYENNIQVDWFFPNATRHNGYEEFVLFSAENNNLEHFFYEYCRANKPVYTHVITHFLEICIPIFKKIKQVTQAKIIVIDHNPRPLGGYPLNIKIKKYLKGLLYSKYIDLFVGVSDYSKNELIKDFGQQLKTKAVTIFNGLEIKKFKRKEDFELKYKFMVASHLRLEKGIQDLIQAVQELVKDKKLVFSIDIYGSGYYQAELEKMIQDYSLENYFNFKGSVTNLHEIYCQYDYLIHPSQGETFCYSVVEGLLCNLPVITNNQGNVLGFIKDTENGFLYKDGQIQQLKEILVRIVNKEIKIENGLIKRPEVAQLSLETMVNNHFNLLS